MALDAFRLHNNSNRGRVSVLFLLFALAIYEFINAGFSTFAIICISPLIIIAAILCVKNKHIAFWALIFINYYVQWFGKNQWLPNGIPMSMYNELLEIILIGIIIIDVRHSPNFERCLNIMLFSLLIWGGFCIIEMLNDTCGLGIDIGKWYTGARLLGLSLLYIFIVFSTYITSEKILIKYLIIWGALALFSVFWTWKQQNIGFTDAEYAWLYTVGRSTHVLNGGTLIRYFSTYNDAANFGVGIASTSVAFFIFGITTKIKKYKTFFFVVGIACAWAMFASGTRTATACIMAGLMFYIILSKSLKIALPFSVLFAIGSFFLVFTNIGDGNSQIRRMRSVFDKNDASANVRKMNQEAIKKYLEDAPWGIGIGMNFDNVPANNKYNKLSKIPPDSEYVFIWVHTGIIGITVFLITTVIMLFGASWITLFKINSPSLRGIGAGLCCAFVSQQLGGYGNQVLLGYPNGLVFYGGLTIVYILPYIEKGWIDYENKQLAIEAEKKRLKLEKKKESRV